jgi:hypothetical protein
MAARHPGKVAAKNINRDGGGHQDCAHPETPISVHAHPVRSGAGLAVIAIAFGVVLVSGHVLAFLRRAFCGETRAVAATVVNANCLLARVLGRGDVHIIEMHVREQRVGPAVNEFEAYVPSDVGQQAVVADSECVLGAEAAGVPTVYSSR